MLIEEFVFRKRDGSLRILRGTRDFVGFEKKHPDKWEGEFKPKGERAPSEGVITLIDLDIMKWRSIKPETIISTREVSEKFSPKYRFRDNDGWIRSNTLKPNFIKRDAIPYHILMWMNRVKAHRVPRSIVETVVESIVETEGRELTRRNGHIRAFDRAFRLLLNNGFIEHIPSKSKIVKTFNVKITDKGRDLLFSSVR